MYPRSAGVSYSKVISCAEILYGVKFYLNPNLIVLIIVSINDESLYIRPLQGLTELQSQERTMI